ncbi:MAG: glycosyltransferase [Phycisphaerae bacterium]|nr:glycosyltransferase [Phycisphaerae bacterium]
MKSETPRVSVIMSVRNGAAYLREAVDSILAQSFGDFEFIIVDDASDDETPRILAEYAAADSRIVLLVNDENLRLSRSLNRALAVARGTYIARQDADDLSLPDRFARQVERFDAEPDLGLLGTAFDICDANGRRVGTQVVPITDTEIRLQMLFDNAFCHASMMLRRRVLPGVIGGYDATVRYAQDYELWSRLLRVTRGANLAEPLVVHRQHEANVTTRAHDEQQQTAVRIAAREIAEHCPSVVLTLDEVGALRRWYQQPPKRIEPNETRFAQAMLALLDAFERRPDVDPDSARPLCERWRRCVRAALPASAV